jgi:hypothetical protein
VAHRLVDHPGGDAVVLQPGREGVPEVGCAGVFERLQELLLDELGQTGALDWSRISVDSLTNDSARDSTHTAGTRRTATTLDSEPGSGTFGAVEAAPMPDSSPACR